MPPTTNNGIHYQVYRLDANGNPLQDKNHSYRYDAQNRLIAVDGGSTAQYHYNALGQRIHKQTQNQALLFTYDETGKLLGEYGNNGNNITAYQETVWLGNLPVAVVKDNIPYAIHTDHLGTPRVITDAQQREIWQWLDDPFGTTQANEAAFTYHLRFTGQYYDKETGLHYNYHRYYNPKTGRYFESDPIGLAGGVNTYTYVLNNPLRYVDPSGLLSFNFDQFASQVEQNRFDLSATFGTLAATEAFGTMPKTPSELRAFGLPKSEINPYTCQASRWNGRVNNAFRFLGVASNTRLLRDFGRSTLGMTLGAVSTGALIYEGFYDWGVIGRAAWDATSFDE